MCRLPHSSPLTLALAPQILREKLLSHRLGQGRQLQALLAVRAVHLVEGLKHGILESVLSRDESGALTESEPRLDGFKMSSHLSFIQEVIEAPVIPTRAPDAQTKGSEDFDQPLTRTKTAPVVIDLARVLSLPSDAGHPVEVDLKDLMLIAIPSPGP